MDSGGSGLILSDTSRDHVSDDEVLVLPFLRRKSLQRLLYVGACSVGPDRALCDFAGEFDHRLAQGGQHNRRQRTGLWRRSAEILDELAYVAERLSHLQPQPLMYRTVTDANAEAEAAVRDLVDKCRALRIIERVPGVDIGNIGAEGNLMGDEGQSFAHSHAIAHTSAVNTREAFVFEPVGQFKRCLSPLGHRSQTYRRFLCHKASLIRNEP